MHDNILSSPLKKMMRRTLWVFVGLLIFGLATMGYLYFAVLQTANHFMGSIFQEDIQAAYALIVPDVQQKISYESFEKSVKTAYVNNSPDIRVRWRKQKVQYRGAYLSGNYTTTNDVIVQVEIELRRQAFDWRVAYFKTR